MAIINSYYNWKSYKNTMQNIKLIAWIFLTIVITDYPFVELKTYSPQIIDDNTVMDSSIISK